MFGVSIPKVMVDNRATVNVMPTSTMVMLNRMDEDLVKFGVTITDFRGGVASTKEVLAVDLQVGSKTTISAFFVVDASASYNALLDQDWMHSAK